MIYRYLGNSGLQVSALCFGAMTFTGENGWKHVGSLGQKEADEIIAYCIDKGVNFFDTADIYSSGESEKILGKALGTKRKDAVICTKVGFRIGDGVNDTGCSRSRIMRGCEESLRRLGTDYIDLYLIHAYDPAVPLEETMQGLNDLVREGKVRYVGCSNFTGWQLMKAAMISRENGWPKLINVQVLYNLVQRDVESDILPVCLDQGIGMTIWGPLAGGFLSGKYRKNLPWPTGTRLVKPGAHNPFDEEKGFSIINELEKIAEARDTTISQAGLNWLLQKRGVTSIVVGARYKSQLIDNLKVVEWNMTPDEIRKLDDISIPQKIYPHWYNDIYRKDRY